MLHKLSTKIAQKLITYSGEEKEAIYIYGLELIISTTIGLSSILLISNMLFELKSGLIFIAMFVPLRLFTGGYHAVTYSKCFVVSNCSYLLILFLKCMMWNKTPLGIWFVLLLIVSYYIATNAPIINPAQPINEYKQKRSKRIAMYVLAVDVVAILYWAINRKELMCMAVLSIGLVAVFMLITDKSIFMKSAKRGVTAL